MIKLKPWLKALPAVATLAGGMVVAAPPAGAAAQCGPAPTEAGLEASRGPFSVTTTDVTGQSGFGGGKIYTPSGHGCDTFGAVVLSPGFLSPWAVTAWMGPRLASHGIVVLGIETNSPLDQPAQRGEQVLAALNHLTEQSPVRDKVDPDRLAAGGYSMGGGGTLEAAKKRPSLKAALPMGPWHAQDKSWPEVTAPTLILGGESDSIAPVDSHAIPFHESLTGTPEKAYLELAGEGHLFGLFESDAQAVPMIAWLKRHVDDDTRYTRFLCDGDEPGFSTGSTYSDVRMTCPM